MMDDQSSKTRKHDQTDRISSLPDAILCHILSFMPTKYAVRTSLLSTRWKSLWTSVPSFDFDSYTQRGYDDESSGFMDFVDRVLLFHDLPNINKFRLQCHLAYHNPYRVSSWIGTAIKRNVQELLLDLDMDFVFELPRNILTSGNLVTLKLSGEVIFRFPMLVSLPSLKVLHFGSLGFPDDESFKNLLSGCPVLEELKMKRCQRDKISTLCICSSTLKKLIIGFSSMDTRFQQHGVLIKAPSLEILKLSYHVSKAFDVDELPSLVKADFGVSFPNGNNEEDCYNFVDGMLRKIPNVQHLRLTLKTLEVLIQASAYNLLLLDKLTHLHINVDQTHTHCLILLDLLEHMPNVKVLVFNKGYKWGNSCFSYATPKIVPKCLSLCLETIDYSGFEGSKEDMKLIRYLLKNAMVLKKLTLTSCTRNKRIKTNILKFPRGSSTCEIKLLYEEDVFSVVDWP